MMTASGAVVGARPHVSDAAGGAVKPLRGSRGCGGERGVAASAGGAAALFGGTAADAGEPD